MGPTVADIKRRLQDADAREFAVLERALVADSRKGVRDAVEVARRRLEAEAAERARLEGLYACERELAAARGGGVVVGLDEVGRGPLAGPLAVGAVVLPAAPLVEGLNDSKKLSAVERERVAERVKEVAAAWTVEYVEASDIDACGMTASLATAFRRAVARVEAAGVDVGVVLLDGNPLRLDEREVSVVKGDGRCASIAAASIVAKVERDALMRRYAEEYPEYGFESCKGYASPAHIEAIRRHGLTPIHRATFCTAFVQPTLF
ncbi:ribonuclease HII [Gordonibacter sp. An230]|uniref:ribonuclease HII n=1 Tax=Gordonibacter sp. An230 TaxID=1965592 RepID=UPI000B394E2B|nr:ribonuclease HII [Gordonibacter sp. An230]OUO90752.1 ribonuclease HII [Gordonibacter sp. An230]